MKKRFNMTSYVISFRIGRNPARTLLPTTPLLSAGRHKHRTPKSASPPGKRLSADRDLRDNDPRMKYLFGPVNSRRLGRSLGIDLIPSRICNFNCIYCEAGAKQLITAERRTYSPIAAILAELKAFLAAPNATEGIDCITLTASGEPTLHRDIGDLIRGIRQLTDAKIAVLTNGSLVHLGEVRTALTQADIVIPSLDAALVDSFAAINRPAQGTDLARIIDGLTLFSQGFHGELWLEVLLARGINDRPEDIAALGQAINRIKPQRVQLNTVVRPPLEQSATPLDKATLEKIAAELPGQIEIIASFHDDGRKNFRTATCDDILEMVRRRPCTTEDIRQALGLADQSVEHCLAELTDAGRIETISHGDGHYHRVIAAATDGTGTHQA